jgi:protein O-mannosyl-transferase
VRSSNSLHHVRSEIWICLFLTILTLAVYHQVGSHQFVNFDDGGYIYENPRVVDGLTIDNIVWAFTTGHESNWHPVTWISHMIDCNIYGLDPGRHHATNLFIHICNALLLFLLLRKLTGELWPSALVAALFSIHPLQVESVAWVSERKNLLCGLFWILTLLGYIRYIARPCLGRYLAMISFFALGLMAKPMIVTLPFVLLLLDYWPLCRTRSRLPRYRIWYPLIVEKIPFFLLSALSSAVTLLVQQKGGAVTSFQAYPLWARVANATVSYAAYIKNMVWPFNLAIFYPLPGEISVWQVLGATCLLSAISFWVLKNANRRPYALVGWLWYAGTLIPVIGLVQVGSQAMADRYAYLPAIGLFMGIVWTAAGFFRNRKIEKKWPAITAAAALVIFSITTWIQAGYWKDSFHLFSRALSVTSKNYVAHNNLGLALEARARPDEAAFHYSKSLQIHPEYGPALINSGNALAKKGNIEGAIRHYSKALKLKPGNSRAYKNYGLAMVRMGRPDEAISLFRKALQIDPDYPDAHNDIGIALAVQGKIDEAISHFKEALRLAPGHEKAANALRLALAAKNNS